MPVSAGEWDSITQMQKDLENILEKHQNDQAERIAWQERMQRLDQEQKFHQYILSKPQTERNLLASRQQSAMMITPENIAAQKAADAQTKHVKLELANKFREVYNNAYKVGQLEEQRRAARENEGQFMQKKHFELIATVIKGIRTMTDLEKEQLAEKFALALQGTNYNFNHSRFIQACMEEK